MFGDFPLSHKIVVVTGGGSVDQDLTLGIGLAFCKLALASRARVIIADLKLSGDAEKLVHDNTDVVFFCKCDVRKWGDLEALIAFSQSKFQDVPDVYVANAGVAESKRSGFWADAEDDRYAVLDVNLSHPIKLSRIAIRALLSKDKKGVILITASVAGLHGHLSTPLYSASKHGTIGLVKSLALAETEMNVKVVGICPGLVYTPLLVGIAEDGGAQIGGDPAFIEPSEIASRMKDLIEQGQYRGGTALGVYRPGHVEVVANGYGSELEKLAPSDLIGLRDMLAKDR